MKIRLLLSLSFLTLLSFSGCFEKDSDKNPEPEQPKNFKGCRLVKEVLTGFSQGGRYESTSIYHYDQNNRIIKRDVVSQNGNVNHSVIYDYDADGNLILEKTSIGSYDEIHYIYNSAGKLVERKRFGKQPGGVIKQNGSHFYVYDSNNQLDTLKSYSYHVSPPKYEGGSTYRFFPDGQLKQRSGYSITLTGIDTVYGGGGNKEVYNYDTYKHPYSLPSFTLKYALSETGVFKNNILSSKEAGNHYTSSYKYNADSLVTEQFIIEENVKIEYVYDCN